MTKQNKIILFILLVIITLLAVFSFGQIFGLHFGFGRAEFFNPGGTIALQEKDLLIRAVLIMLIAVVPAFFMLFFFAWKYRASRQGEKYSPDTDGKKLSWLIWLIPGTVIIILSFINWKTTHELDPGKAIASGVKPMTIEVVALQWKFLFIYPEQNIATVNFIEFPQGTPVHFQLTADAPMSSFWIPELGSQIYAMSGMTTQLNLIANQAGDFRGLNTEINGTGFSGMKFIARATSQSDFDQWVSSVQQSNQLLSLDVYNKLSEPSQNNPSATYSTVEKNLYNTVVMKFMEPAASTSSPMMMPGMDMK